MRKLYFRRQRDGPPWRREADVPLVSGQVPMEGARPDDTPGPGTPRGVWLVCQHGQLPFQFVSRFRAARQTAGDAREQSAYPRNPARANPDQERSQLPIEPWAVELVLRHTRTASPLIQSLLDEVGRCIGDVGISRLQPDGRDIRASASLVGPDHSFESLNSVPHGPRAIAEQPCRLGSDAC